MARITETQAKLAAQQYLDKIKRENIVTPAIRRIFNNISNAVSSYYGVTGSTYNVNEFLGEWTALLKNHYRATSKLFTGIQFLPMDGQFFNAMLSVNLRKFINSSAVTRATEITATNALDVNTAIDAAKAEVFKEGFILTPSRSNLLVARLAKRNMNTAFNARTGTIASTETQNAAEGSKRTEAETYLESESRESEKQPVIMKKWVTVGDERTRDAHRAANGQMVREEVPFIVGGEQLMYPGDSSMGASLGNIVRCRCTTLYITK